MIGLSVSLCVEDIVGGKAKINDVIRIIGRTCIRTREKLDEVITWYRDANWCGNPDLDECEHVMRQLFSEGKITQPRVLTNEDNCVPRIQRKKHWIENESEITWLNRTPTELICIPLLEWPVTIIT